MSTVNASSGGWVGPALGLGSAVLFGASTPFAKVLVGEVSPWLLAGLLYLGSGLGLLIFRMLQRNREAAEAPLRSADMPWLGAVILTGGVIGPVLLMVGLSSTPASSAALLLNMEGLATMAIAWFVFHENADRRIVAGALAIFAGAVLLSWNGAVESVSFGALAIVGACLAWGVDNNLTRKLSSADPVQIAILKGLAAGAVNLALALIIGAQMPTAPLIAAAGVVGLLGYGVSLVMFVLALRHLGAARTGAYFSAAPFVGAVLGIILLREAITWQLIAASVLMGIGLYLHLAERHEHEHVHEPMEHEHAHVHDEHHQHAHSPNDPIGEPHTHWHQHEQLVHAHPHFPDLHHRHKHHAHPRDEEHAS